MKIIVPIKLVPDLVEELEFDSSGKRLDFSFMRFIVNESDDHALEEAILLKERYGGEVSLIAPEGGEVDDFLFTASARGTDRLVKITSIPEDFNSHHYSAILSEILRKMEFDLILTGTQAVDDLDGQMGILLASSMGLPYIGLVSRVEKRDSLLFVEKSFAGGVRGEYRIEFPAILGVLQAENPPRYVPVAKVRQAMKQASITEIESPEWSGDTGLEILRLYKPRVEKGAEILNKVPEEACQKVVEILENKGILKGGGR